MPTRSQRRSQGTHAEEPLEPGAPRRRAGLDDGDPDDVRGAALVRARHDRLGRADELRARRRDRAHGDLRHPVRQPRQPPRRAPDDVDLRLPADAVDGPDPDPALGRRTVLPAAARARLRPRSVLGAVLRRAACDHPGALRLRREGRLAGLGAVRRRFAPDADRRTGRGRNLRGSVRRARSADRGRGDVRRRLRPRADARSRRKARAAARGVARAPGRRALPRPRSRARPDHADRDPARRRLGCAVHVDARAGVHPLPPRRPDCRLSLHRLRHRRAFWQLPRDESTGAIPAA